MADKGIFNPGTLQLSEKRCQLVEYKLPLSEDSFLTERGKLPEMRPIWIKAGPRGGEIKFQVLMTSSE